MLWDQQEGVILFRMGGPSVRIRVLFRLRFGCIWNLGFFLGQRPGIFILGGQGEGRGWGGGGGVESEGWQPRGARGRKGGMYVGGQEWAVPLSPLGLLLSSLPHVFSCSSCRAPHSLSQGHAGGSLRDHCCRTGQLGRLQPARRHPRTETGDPAGIPPSLKPSVSFPSLP